jgi:dihydrofolate reductase
MINIITAIANNNVIGYNNTIPWKLSEDLKRFKSLTINNIVIMGRKTYESLGSKPLPNRINIILTNDKNYKADHCIICSSLNNAVVYCGLVNNIHDYAYALYRDSGYQTATDILTGNVSSVKEYKEKSIFIIGGNKLYEEGLKIANRLYITNVNIDVEGDTYFPKFDIEEWDLQKEEHMELPIEHYYRVYDKKIK